MQIGQQRQQTRGGDRFGDAAVNAAHLEPIRQQHHGAWQRQQHAVGAVEQGVDKGVVQQRLLRDVDRQPDQQQRVVRLAQARQRFAVLDLQRRNAQHLQRRVGRGGVRLDVGHARARQGVERARQRRRVGVEIELYPHPEGRAFVDAAVKGDLAAHFADQLLGNHQPQPRAAVAAGNAGVRLAKRLKQLGLLLLGNADAGIVHLNFQLDAHGADCAPFDAQIDSAAFGKLNGVSQQIDQNLLQAQRIADNVIRHAAVAQHRQLQPFFVRRGRQQHNGFIQGGAQRERDRLQHQLTRFQLGEVEHVVDNAK